MDDLLRRRLQRLPQRRGEVWQGASVCLRTWVTPPDEEPFRPWLVFWASATDSLILAQIPTEEEPSLYQVREGLITAMQRPAVGPPHRPGEVQVRDPALAAYLEELLDPLDVRCVLCEELEEIDHILAALEAALGLEPIPGHLSIPGVTPAQVAGLFQAAAGFYRRTPWQYVDDSVPLAVQSAAWSPEPWYAVIMGHGGIIYGLALHQSLELLEQMYSGLLSDAGAGRQMEALSLTFGDVTEMAFDDLEAMEQYGWEIAGPEAYPFVYRVDPGVSMRRPLPQEIDLVEACLRALPPFVEEHLARPPRGGGSALPSFGPLTQEVSVPITSGEMALRLSTVEVHPRFPFPFPRFAGEGPGREGKRLRRRPRRPRRRR